MLFLSVVVVGVVLIVVGALILFMKTMLSQHLTQATAHLNELNEDYTKKLEDARRRTQDADEYYDKMVLKAKSDAEIEKARILREAHETESNMVAAARQESGEIVEKAHKTTELFMKEFEARVAERASDKACEIVQGILPGIITRDMHEAWLESMSRHGFEELDRLNVGPQVAEATVTTAHPLSAAHRSALEKKIAAKLGREIRFNVEIDPSMIAGVRIRIGSVLIDGSLKFKIKEASRHARD